MSMPLTTLVAMRPTFHPQPVQDRATSFYWSGDAIRSRSIADVVLWSCLQLPALPARMTADCDREMARMGLETGDVEALSLARARTRWPEYRQCVQAVTDWTHAHGLAAVLAASDAALMACRGARYHHDGAQYGAAAFCNLFLSEDGGLDLHFAATGHRIPLARGTAVVFDTGQPHAVIHRGRSGFDAADFVPAADYTQLFLTWELPIEATPVARALQIMFDTDTATAGHLQAAQLWRRGAPAAVCAESGQWCRAE